MYYLFNFQLFNDIHFKIMFFMPKTGFLLLIYFKYDTIIISFYVYYYNISSIFQ